MLEVKEKKRKMKTGAKEIFGWAESLVIAVVALILINSFVLRTTGVVGESMSPTLMPNDYLAVSKLFNKAPNRGDIVIFYSAGYWNDILVKRVIADAGDVVDIDYATGNVSVNGEFLKEPYTKETIRNPSDVQMPYTVPEGCVFVMGDNRNHSTDSRSTLVGPIKYESIIGKVQLRLFPLNKIGMVK